MSERPREIRRSDDELPPKRERVAAQLVAAFRDGTIPTDSMFDRVLSRRLRLASCAHWTPIQVVVRVAEWLERHDIPSIVDIGAGAGKFCVVAALLTGRKLVGIEQRPWLVAEASALARLMGVESRVEMIHATLGRDPLPRGDAYYLFNPFGENLFDAEDALDSDVELGVDRWQRDIAATRAALDGFADGTYVLTYNGFGGPMPEGYRSVECDRALPNVLRLWRKEPACATATPPAEVLFSPGFPRRRSA